MLKMAATTVHRAPDTEGAEIQDLYRLFLLEKAPALIGPDRTSIPLPASIYNILVQVLGYLKEGKGVSVVPVMQVLTTQHAANLLGMSRPFLIDLLNHGKIPFHKVGTHRRIYRKDVMDYQAERDQNRRRILAEMARRAVAEGDYDQVYVPDEGE
jgi:excisionase family DNA binding protein